MPTKPLRHVLLYAAVFLGGCGFPEDPAATTERVRSGTLVIGVLEGSSFASFRGETPAGADIDIAMGLASRFSAEPQWVRGSVDQLLYALDNGEVDLLVGGLATSTVLSSRTALSHPVGRMPLGPAHEGRVFALRMGEIGWQLEVNRFIGELGVVH
ncbi:transporter substrate-binding domain-containing protein [Aureimonas glaciei]|uniref:ABC transporter substrate-binding protein n=1 Tax=Aureimonas glaciei TaxID=1776957 RepID=A0A917DHF5_9HYPH|nr:transporter substrate-binding domain-containing protein [Aureimonas glaciei]GGD37177.1 ABC transporter substrate-binding protein [Aureimonas glaciei]